MPSVDFILELRLGVLSEEYWPLYLVFDPFAYFHFKPKVDEVIPKHGKYFVACQPIVEVGSPYFTSMPLKQRN